MSLLSVLRVSVEKILLWICFMPIVAQTRVLPENLGDLYKRLRPAFDEVARQMKF